MLSTLIIPVTKTDACIAHNDVWTYQNHQMIYGAESGDAMIVLRGFLDIPTPLETLKEQISIEVSHDGIIIAGTLEETPVRGYIIWRAAEALNGDIEYEVSLTTKPPGNAEPREHNLVAQWPTTPVPGRDIQLNTMKTEGYAQELFGDCLEDVEAFSSCGGCELEIVGQEAHWRAQVSLDIDQRAGRIMMGRMAIGRDQNGALESLNTTPFTALLIHEAGTLLGAIAGAQKDFTEDDACVAIEVVEPDGAVVFETVECVEVPRTEVDAGQKLTPPGDTQGPKTAQPQDSEMGDDEVNRYGAGGCSVTSGGTGEGTALLLALFLVFGRRRLRR